jgi:hypothetical protein
MRVTQKAERYFEQYGSETQSNCEYMRQLPYFRAFVGF